MDRYSFSEIKGFSSGDIFWAKNDKWIVSDTPLYYNHSQFYGDFSEKIEWKAVSTSNSQEHTFVVHNVIEGDDPNPLIFKTSTTEPLLGSSNIKKN